MAGGHGHGEEGSAKQTHRDGRADREICESCIGGEVRECILWRTTQNRKYRPQAAACYYSQSLVMRCSSGGGERSTGQPELAFWDQLATVYCSFQRITPLTTFFCQAQFIENDGACDAASCVVGNISSTYVIRWDLRTVDGLDTREQSPV